MSSLQLTISEGPTHFLICIPKFESHKLEISASSCMIRGLGAERQGQ